MQTAVEKLQTDTGVKDPIAVYWIPKVLERSREIQQVRMYNHATRDPRLNDKSVKDQARVDIKNGILDEIQPEVFAWLLTQPPERYQLLPIDSREFIHSHFPLDPALTPHSPSTASRVAGR